MSLSIATISLHLIPTGKYIPTNNSDINKAWITIDKKIIILFTDKCNNSFQIYLYNYFKQFNSSVSKSQFNAYRTFFNHTYLINTKSHQVGQISQRKTVTSINLELRAAITRYHIAHWQIQSFSKHVSLETF